MSKPSAGSSEGDGSPWPDEGGDGTWKRRIGRQREKRLGIDDLWRKLDDLINDASDFPAPTEPCTLSTPTPAWPR
ncbi:hypothetical protein T484DRAFT_1980369 [Baffinella frigidus]|nr:hypothetical protein T484DRAFT_1980369 [Cryptophyta sp. CCMP2293]